MSDSSKKNHHQSLLTAFVFTIILTLAMSVFLYYQNIFNFKIIVLFSGLVFTIFYLIMNFYIEKNIYKRVDKIYKNIMILESKSTPVQNITISKDLDFLENEINKYAKLKKLEVRAPPEFFFANSKV